MYDKLECNVKCPTFWQTLSANGGLKFRLFCDVVRIETGRWVRIQEGRVGGSRGNVEEWERGDGGKSRVSRGDVNSVNIPWDGSAEGSLNNFWPICVACRQSAQRLAPRLAKPCHALPRPTVPVPLWVVIPHNFTMYVRRFPSLSLSNPLALSLPPRFFGAPRQQRVDGTVEKLSEGPPCGKA